VTTARDLTESQFDQLKQALKAAIGSDVQIDTEVDRDLLGGLVVRVGSRMIDTSLATKLTNLQLAMKEA
jgi:F-type H+-transporting ATPase subunit delta